MQNRIEMWKMRGFFVLCEVAREYVQNSLEMWKMRGFFDLRVDNKTDFSYIV